MATVTGVRMRPGRSSAPDARRPLTAFVLAGGASLGAMQAGMLSALYERQGGRCICGATLGDRWHTDHDHATGRIRGLLHHYCNRHFLPWVARVGLDRLTTYLAA